jgi:hypothetical protein
MKKYSEFISESYHNIYNEDILLFESNFGYKFGHLKKIEASVMKDLKIRFNFLVTYGVAVTAFYPIINNLIKNMSVKVDLSLYDVILLTICGLAVFFKENKDKIDVVISLIKEKGLVEIYNKIFKSLEAIKEFFIKVAEGFGKTILNIFDIFSYTALLVPFLSVILDLINKNNITVDTIKGYLFTAGIGVAISAAKNIIQEVVKILREKFSKK